MSDNRDFGAPSPQPRYVQTSPRLQYRRARNRRKTIIYGSAILGLAAAFSVGALGVAGILPSPFESEFSRAVRYAEVGDTPCPTEGARPVSPADVGLAIYNTTSTPGQAGKAAEYLEAQGYRVITTDNAPLYRGNVQIEAGPRGVDAAYTVARYFGNNVRIRLNETEDKTLNILLGEQFDTMPDDEQTAAINERSFALVPLEGCLPVKEPAGGWAVPESLQSGQSGQSGQSE